MPTEIITNPQQHRFQTHGDPVITTGSTQSYHPLPSMILSVDEAIHIIYDQTPAPIAVVSPVNESIIGSVVAEDVYSAENTPAVDGYTVIVEGEKISNVVLPRAQTVNTGFSRVLNFFQPRTVESTAIGAPLSSSTNDDVAIGEKLQDLGSHFGNKSQIFARGDTLSAVGGAISSLAMAGVQTVTVFEKPRVGILGISNEVTEHTRRIYNASRLAVVSGLVSWGIEFLDLGIVRSTPHDELERSLCAHTDVILLINDASTNEIDPKLAIEKLGGWVHFNQVQVRPSINTLFATIPVKAPGKTLPQRTSRPIFSLPNSSPSALVALNLFVLPCLQKLGGMDRRNYNIATLPLGTPQLGLPQVAVVLADHFPRDPERTEYHLAVVTGSCSDARLYATSINEENTCAQDSLGVSSTKANALVILRAGRGVGIKGEIVDGLLMGTVYGSDLRLIC